MSFLRAIFRKKDTILVITFLLFLVKILGFVKIRVFSEIFGGPSQELDLFWAAFVIPDTIYGILVAGTINAAIVPVFSDVLYKKGEGRLVKLFTVTTMAFAVVSIIAVGIIYLFIEPIAEFLLSSGSWGTGVVLKQYTQQDVDTLIRLMQIMLISPVFLGFSAIGIGFLQTHKKFFVATLSPLIYNVALIFGSIILAGKFDMGAFGLAWAVVIGSMMNFIILLPVIISFIRKHLNIKSFSHIGGKVGYYNNELKEILRLGIPRMLAAMGEQINVMINTLISFSLPWGALSAYKFALSLHLFPVQIFGYAVAQVVFSDLAEHYSKNNFDKFRESFRHAFKTVLFITLPAAVILIVLRLPIVRLTIGTDGSEWRETVLTSWALALLAGAVIAHSLLLLIYRGMYAIQETRIPLVITFVVIIFNIIAGYYFTNFLSHYQDWRPILEQIYIQLKGGAQASGGAGLVDTLGSFWSDLGVWFTTRNKYDAAVGGLALSLSLSFMLEAVLNLYFLNRRMGVLNWATMYIPAIKMFVASATMFVIMYIVYRVTDFSLDTTRTINVIGVAILTTIPGLSIYLFMCTALGIKETEVVYTSIDRIVDFIKEKFEKIFVKKPQV